MESVMISFDFLDLFHGEEGDTCQCENEEGDADA